MPEAGDRAVDELRIFLAQARIIEAEFGQPPDLEVLDQHVRSRGELAHNAPPALALEIELNRALAAIGGMKIGRGQMTAAGSLDERRPPGAGVITGPRALHLDHVGAEVGEDLACPRSCQDAGKLEHA